MKRTPAVVLAALVAAVFLASALLIGPCTDDAHAATSPSVYFADLSGYNENVDLAAYKKAGHVIVALKADEGTTFTSDNFFPRFRRCHELHMVCMAYHFARPSRGPPEPSARHFAAVVKKAGWRAGDIGVLDWEDPGWTQKGTDWIIRFVRQAQLEGVRVPVLYSYGPYVAARITSTANLDYWHAGYIRDPLSTAPVFARSRAVALQFTNGQDGATPHYLPGMGTLAGTRHGDVNRRTVSLDRFRAMAYSATPTVKGGDTGPNVKWVVDRLSQLGYLPYPNIGRPRSVFGGWVNTAVVHFKRDYHLPTTPVVDNPTRAAIVKAINARKGVKPKTTKPLAAPPVKKPKTLPQKKTAAELAPVIVKAKKPVAHCLYNLPLRSGNGGRDVAVLHVRMTELGLWPKAASGHASRYFGKGTKVAVQRFQRLRHLSADGVVGSSTNRALGMSVCLPSLAQLKVTVGLDSYPTFRGLALVLQDARAHNVTGSVNSSDRRPGVAERYGHSSQALLYRCYKSGGQPVSACHGNRNPANPPGCSTHELISDGVPYAGPRCQRRLVWWQLGLDLTNSESYRSKLRALGYCVIRPYSGGSEFHHLNLCADPTPVLRRHRLAQ